MSERNTSNKSQTPFARLLRRWMYEQNNPDHEGPEIGPQQLAVLFGVQRQTIYKWLGGESRPEPDNLLVIAKKTGIPIKDLYQAAGHPLPRALVEAFVDYAIERMKRADTECTSEKDIETRLRELGEEYVAAGSSSTPDTDGH